MKKIIIYNIIITLFLYIIIYLIYSWCIWEFINPIQWIINIPTYSNLERFMLLFGIGFYERFLIGCINNWKEIIEIYKEQLNN